MSRFLSRAARAVAHALPVLAGAALPLPGWATPPAPAASAASLARPASTLSFDQALSLALQRSQAGRAARAGASGAAEVARAAGRGPDPMLRLGIENLPVQGPDRFSARADSQTMKRIGLSQEWLPQDKRAARQAAADATLAQERVQAEAADADVRLQTALAYVEAFYADQSLALTALTEHHLHESLAAATARLAAATGNGADVLALTAALGAAEDDTADAQQQQSAADIALQRWVGPTTGVTTGATTGASVDSSAGVQMSGPAAPPAVDLAALPAWPLPAQAAFVASAAAVRTAQARVEVARQNAAVTALERRPNWTWEVSYGQRSGYADMVSVGVTIPLAVAPAQRQDRETAAKLSLVDQAEAELAEAQRMADADYAALASDAQRLQQRIERYEAGVLTPTQQRTAATLAAYAANQASLADLFESRHAEVEARRKLLTLQRGLARAQVRLAFTPLFPILSTEGQR